jgi:hypothetical protein
MVVGWTVDLFLAFHYITMPELCIWVCPTPLSIYCFICFGLFNIMTQLLVCKTSSYPMPPHGPYGLRGLPPGCGWSVTDFWGWDTHEAQLHCPDEVDGDIGIWSTNYPDHGHHGEPPLSGKNTHGRARNRTRDLMISSRKRWPQDHEPGLWSVSIFIQFLGNNVFT